MIWLFLISMTLSSCSPQPQGKSDLPNYSDMSAAADAGRTPALVITNDNYHK
jgi:hypothetical protein